MAYPDCHGTWLLNQRNVVIVHVHYKTMCIVSGSNHSHINRSILVVCLAMILMIPGTPGVCQLVFIAGWYPWRPSCFPHHRHTAIAAALPARLRTHGSSQTVHTTVLPAAAAASLLDLSDWAEGSGDIYMGHAMGLKLQYSDCHWGGMWPGANWLQTASERSITHEIRMLRREWLIGRSLSIVYAITV